jgi:pyruvate/2-oxoglutarate dehydrogenase complex dihydrolipoamide acyltransferase (E2) component
VLAAAAGRVARLRDGVQDISIRAPGAPSVAGQECGNGVVIDHGDGWETQYCHMARGSLKVKAGDTVAAGQPIGRVGLSGDTEFPHLHLTVRHGGHAVDPFAPAPVAPPACAPQAPLWTAQAARELSYKRGAVLNSGFGAAVSPMDAIEGRAVAAPTAASPAVVAYVRLIGLEAGDIVQLTLRGPDGGILATASQPPLDHDKAQWVSQVGRKAPGGGWPHGVYKAEVQVHRAGAVALTGRWQMAL